MTHPDTDVLAEFCAGLITGRRGVQVADHLASCERCTALSGQLAEVSDLLAAIPAPAMPQSVASRLDTVLAAEMAEKRYPERDRGDSPPQPGTSQRRAGSRGFRSVALRVLAPAAAALLLAATGYGLSSLGGSASRTTSGSAAAPTTGRTNVHAAPGVHQGLSRPAQVTFKVVTSRTDYQPATLRQELPTEVSAPHPADTVKPASELIRACVDRVTGGADPVLVENARFRGQQATIIVVAGDSGYLVWVAGADCSAANGHVIYKTTLPGI